MIDIPLFLATGVIFISGVLWGGAEYRRLVAADPEVALEKFHRKPGWVRFALVGLTLSALAGLVAASNRTAFYKIPDWLDVSLYYWAHGSGAALFGLLLGLAWHAYGRERKANLRALLLAAGLCQVALVIGQYAMLRYVSGSLSDVKYAGSPLLQTSSSSCAAASGANVAGFLGLKFSEREMARFMETRACGTSPRGIIRGLAKAGLKGSLVEQDPARPDLIPLPMIMLMHHPELGPESHAVAVVRFFPKNQTLEIWDPLRGKEVIRKNELPNLWAGHGIAVSKSVSEPSQKP